MAASTTRVCDGEAMHDNLLKALFLVLLLTEGARACPSLQATHAYLVEGNLSGVQEAVKCGFDVHREGDKALYIAELNGRTEVAGYLRSLGLRDNAEYVQNAWLRDLHTSRALGTLASLYELDTRQKLSPESWFEAMSKYLESRGEGKERLNDAWGRPYEYRGRTGDRMNPHLFCSMGRDGKPRGERYDKDICSNDDRDKLGGELKEIGFF